MSPLNQAPKVETPPAPESLSGLLQGTWKRTSYPFGTIIFRGNEVKFDVGEGAAEPATFQKFRLSDSCPYDREPAANALAQDYLVLEAAEACNAVRLAGDTFFINYDLAGSGVAYVRAQKETAPSLKQAALPKILQGTWAQGKDHCGMRNANRITIDARTIRFFEGDAELVEITEYEPTRIAGSFRRKAAGGGSGLYRFTLDVQQEGTVLIMRQYGEGAPAGPARYERCE